MKILENTNLEQLEKDAWEYLNNGYKIISVVYNPDNKKYVMLLKTKKEINNKE